MKQSLKDFPKCSECASGKVDACDTARDMGECPIGLWKNDFEKELKEKLAYHDKMVIYWESEKAKTHPLSRYRTEIASEWRVSRGTLKEILGDSE